MALEMLEEGMAEVYEAYTEEEKEVIDELVGDQEFPEDLAEKEDSSLTVDVYLDSEFTDEVALCFQVVITVKHQSKTYRKPYLVLDSAYSSLITKDLRIKYEQSGVEIQYQYLNRDSKTVFLLELLV